MAKSTTYQAVIALGAKLDKKFPSVLKNATKMADGLGKSFATAGKIAATGAGVMGAGMVAATGAAIKLGQTVVKQFGELEQNLGGSEAVFGKYASWIQKTGEDAYKNLGVSQSDYLATANKMGALFQGSGIEQRESLYLTEKAMQRAADMASVMGIDTQVAMDSVAGAAKGNFTMMDNLGVAMNATTIQAYATANGLDFVWQKATAAEKAEMAMKMFFENTEQYAGNFAKESTETISGSIGLLKAATSSFVAGLGNSNADMENLTGNVVDAFEAVAKNVVPIFGNIAKSLPVAFKAAAPQLKAVAPIILGAFSEIAPEILKAGIEMLPEFAPLAVSFISMFGSTLIQNAPMLGDAALKLGKGLINSIANAVPGARPMLDILHNMFGDIFENVDGKKASETLKSVANTASKFLVPVLKLVQSGVKIGIDLFKQVSPVITPIAGGVSELALKLFNLANAALPVVGSMVTSLAGILNATLGPALSGMKILLGGLIDFITGIFSGNWELAWSGVVDIFKGIFYTMQGIAKGAINAVIGLINMGINNINSLNFTMPDWSPIKPGESLGINIPTIPMFANGVRNFSGGPAIVGEKGAELLNLPRGSDVFSNRETKSILSSPMDLGGLGDIILQVTNYITGADAEAGEKIAELTEAALEKMLARIKAKHRRKGFAG